jgi:tripartite-type tricarboxylate transporter receptor subunit TctC
VLGSAEMKAKFAEQNMLIPAHKSAAEFSQVVKNDMALWQQLAKVAKLKVD